MNPTMTILLSSAGIAILYLLGYAFGCCVSRRELKERAKRKGAAWYLDAKEDELEYELRLFLMANGFRREAIVVKLPKNAAEREEMLSIVRMMRRRHKNILIEKDGTNG